MTAPSNAELREAIAKILDQDIPDNDEQEAALIDDIIALFQAREQQNKHWYMGFDENGKVAMFPKEIGLPLKQATETTIDTLKQQLLTELLGELPEKCKQVRGNSQNPDNNKYRTRYGKGFNEAIDQVVSVIERKIGELNG